MFSKLAYLSPLLSSVDAGWNFGWNCPVVYPKMDLDTKKFEGKWYEIFRDVDHNTWSDQLCTMDYYKSKFLS
jgi:lipocalin